ncbi:hypothetical protein ABES58_23070 [Paenibacillus lautus]|uniref:hypothetical protein n=1 Tax=Paenibacillus TaxID=44249 RepID=UPI0036BD7588
MKKRSKLIISTLIALSTIIAAIPNANATVFSYKRTTGIFNAYYDYSVAQYGYTSQFDWARSQWSGISSKVSIGKSSKQDKTTDMYFVDNISTSGVYGQVINYKNGGSNTVDPNVGNWDYSVVILYDNNLASDGLKNDTNIKNSALHEVGHSLALAHTNISNSTERASSVMTAGTDTFKNRNITSPSTYDKGELKYKWGN